MTHLQSNLREEYFSPLSKIWTNLLRYAFVLQMLWLCSLSAFSKTTTLTIDGLYVEVYSNSEISDYYAQKWRGAEGKKHQWYIDFESYKTFIPLTNDISVEIPEEDFKYNSNSLDYHVYFPGTPIYTFYRGAGFNSKNYKINKLIATTALELAPYHVSKSGDSIYKIAFMTVEIENSDLDNDDMNYLKTTIHKLGLDEDLWMVKKVINYNPYINIPWLKMWGPYKQFNTESNH